MNRMLQGFLRRTIKKGSLAVTDSEGGKHAFGDGTGKPIAIRFTRSSAERNVILNPGLKLGEEFMDGGVVFEEATVYDFLELVFTNLNARYPTHLMRIGSQLRYMTRRLRQMNNQIRARRNVAHHYDLDGRLYSMFLDNDQQYSCAFYEEGNVDDLDAAQLAKKRHLASKLALEPGQRVLDIGSGWGGLGLYLAERCGVDVTGVTLSEEQHAVSNKRAEERGLADRARFLLKDYRKVDGPFDRIVSVGMFEHVGVGHYKEFFAACRDLLTPDGVMLLHSIGRIDGPGDTSIWIQKYIFPGGYIPAVSEVVPAIEKNDLIITDMEILRLHYAETLKEWRRRFMERRDEVKAIYDERFCLMWEFYLASSEVSFRYWGLMNFQIQVTKQLQALPLTRDYMFEAEARLRAADEAAAQTPLKEAGE